MFYFCRILLVITLYAVPILTANNRHVRDQLHWLPVQQRIEYKVCVLVYKCLHQAAPTYLAELCSPVSESANRVTSVQLLGVTLQFYVPEQRDTAKDVSLFLVQHSGTHSHCLLVIHH